VRWPVVLLLVATRAHAENSPETSNDLVSRPLVLDEHQVVAELVIEANAASGSFASPLSFAPDVWVGVLPQLTVGLIHSDPSVDRIAPGASLCVRHDEGGFLCDAVYRGGGLDVIYSALAGPIAVAPHLRVLVRDLDPVKPAITLGAALKWTRGRYAISGDPFLQLGLANTERGNRAALWLPITLAIQPTCRWEFELRTGWNSDLAVITDGWHIPAYAGVVARATTHVDLGAGFGCTSILGPQNTPKERVVFATLGWRS
jgi:hypothetical protein